jgi:hypothetical protein
MATAVAASSNSIEPPGDQNNPIMDKADFAAEFGTLWTPPPSRFPLFQPSAQAASLKGNMLKPKDLTSKMHESLATENQKPEPMPTHIRKYVLITSIYVSIRILYYRILKLLLYSLLLIVAYGC